MHRLLQGGRHRPPHDMNKPLPEPLVDPDEGKTPIGELVIVPIQGRDLPNRERFGKQDPFILFKLGNVSKRSSTDIRGGQRPRWKDDQININMYKSDAKDATSLYVSCLDEDHQKNDLIGDCVINLAKVLEQGEHDDWFELTFKGREAGELQLQLTYYSHDPKHSTNKMNRPAQPAASSTAPARRPIHPVKAEEKVKPVETAHASTDEGPVYKPPVVAEASIYQDPVPHSPQPMVPGGMAGYPYGNPAVAGGRPVSPANLQPGNPAHYVGHHTPQIPAANPYAPTPYLNNANVNVGGYPAYQAGYPSQGNPPDSGFGGVDPKRLSWQQQQQLQQQQQQQQQFQGGFPQGGYPPVNQGYPPQQPQGFPPQGYPPQNNNTHQGGPPAGFPFAASNMYPPNNSGGGNGSGYQQVQQHQPQTTYTGGQGMALTGSNGGNGGNHNNNIGRPVPPIPTSSSSSSSGPYSSSHNNHSHTTLPGSYPNTTTVGGPIGGHKQSVNMGQSMSSYPAPGSNINHLNNNNQQYGNSRPRSLTPTPVGSGGGSMYGPGGL